MSFKVKGIIVLFLGFNLEINVGLCNGYYSRDK